MTAPRSPELQQIIDISLKLIEEAEKLQRYARMRDDQFQDYLILIREIDKEQAFTPDKRSKLYSEMTDAINNPWLSAAALVNIYPLTKIEKKLIQQLHKLEKSEEKNDAENWAALKNKITSTIETVQNLMKPTYDEFVDQTSNFDNITQWKLNNSDKQNNENRVAMLALAIVRTRDQLAINNPTGKYLDELYSIPFREWLKKNKAEAEKLAKIEHEVAVSIANNLTQLCKRELSQIPDPIPSNLPTLSANATSEEKVSYEKIMTRQKSLENKHAFDYQKQLRRYIETDIILESKNSHECASALSRWIKVAEECQKNNDFHTLVIINGLLDSPAIRKLSESYKLIDMELQKKHEEIDAACKPEAMNIKIKSLVHNAKEISANLNFVPSYQTTGLNRDRFLEASKLEFNNESQKEVNEKLKKDYKSILDVHRAALNEIRNSTVQSASLSPLQQEIQGMKILREQSEFNDYDRGLIKKAHRMKDQVGPSTEGVFSATASPRASSLKKSVSSPTTSPKSNNK